MIETRQETDVRNPRDVACRTDTCRIRRIDWRDWKGLAVLFRRLFPELGKTQVAYYIRRYEDTIAVAEVSAGLIGFYQFIPQPDNGTAWLNYIGVLPMHCHRGIGTRLLCDYEARALTMGFAWAELDVLQTNIEAVNFYNKNGYTRLYPVENKFRYRKVLTANVAESGYAPAKKRTHAERLGRLVLYLALVTLPLLLNDL